MRLNHLLLRISVAAVHAWTRAYTMGLPARVAAERRAEMASDLWELQHDPETVHGLALPVHVLLRLATGLADDVCWRLEHRSPSEDALVFRTAAAAAAAAAVLTVLWILPTTPDSRAFGGRRQVAVCADTSPAPQSTTELRLQIMECAGAFFTAPRP
jgi:hypothetical protein